ncbi:MAG: DUF3987 domain-containing protein [Dehalococcoidia bacterium]
MTQTTVAVRPEPTLDQFELLLATPLDDLCDWGLAHIYDDGRLMAEDVDYYFRDFARIRMFRRQAEELLRATSPEREHEHWQLIRDCLVDDDEAPHMVESLHTVWRFAVRGAARQADLARQLDLWALVAARCYRWHELNELFDELMARWEAIEPGESDYRRAVCAGLISLVQGNYRSAPDGDGAACDWLPGGMWPYQGAVDGALWASDPRSPWDEVAPLELPPSLLAAPLRDYAVDNAERIGVRLESVSLALLAALAGTVGRRVLARPKRHDDGWVVCPNLWSVTIGRPGSKKSAAIGAATAPVMALASELHQEARNAELRDEARRAVLDFRRKSARERLTAALRDDDQEGVADAEAEVTRLEAQAAPPKARRIVTHDSTVEKLLELLKENPGGMMVFRDELAGFVEMLAKQGRQGEREFYLEAWEGNVPFSQERIGRGSIRAEAITIAIVGASQPEKWQALVSGASIDGGKGDDGFTQRFQLLCLLPREHRHGVDRVPDYQASDNVNSLFRTVYEMGTWEEGVDGARTLIPWIVVFATEAQDRFDTWMHDHEVRLATMTSPAFESYVAKEPSMVVSLALIDHLAMLANEGDLLSPLPPIGLESLERAIGLTRYVELVHARRLYAAELDPGRVAAQLLLEKMQNGEIHNGLPVREVYRSQWSGLKTSRVVRAGLDHLERLGWARVVPDGRSQMLRLHPSLLPK